MKRYSLKGTGEKAQLHISGTGKKPARILAALLVCAVFAGSILPASPAFAADAAAGASPAAAVSPDSADGMAVPDGMSRETYNKLRDNVIEFAEVPELVRNFSLLARVGNTAVAESTSALKDAEAACSSTIQDLNDSVSDLRDQKNAAQDASQQAVYTNAIALLNARIDGTREAKKNFEKAEKSAATGIKNAMGMHAGEQGIINGMQSAILGYKTLEQFRNMYEKQTELYTAVLAMQNRMQASGLATALDVQQAQYDLNGARLSLDEYNEKLRNLRTTIGTTLGFDAAAAQNLTIADVPGYDASYMGTRNLAADIAAAKVNSAAYAAAQKSDAVTQYAKNQQMFDTAQKLSIAMNSLYTTANQSAAAADAAGTALEIARLQKDAAERRYRLGTIGLTAYKGAEAGYIATEALANVSLLQAFQSVFNYQWAVNGVLDLS